MNRGRGGASIDRVLAGQLHCGRCGNIGNELRAFQRDGSYRAIVICKSCKYVSDF
jgi:hypothetical protein